MLKEHVIGMFKAIDGRDFDALPRYFHEDVVYERPGYAPIEGLRDLLHFYRHVRRIRSGRHDVQRLVEAHGDAVAVGVFRGVLKDGAKADETFADTYHFEDGLIRHRQTFFFRPAI